MARRRLTNGSHLGDALTVLGVVDDGGRDRVYLVWNHQAWSAMACKVYRRAARARREASILRRLQHPNIVRCLGHAENEPPRVLMEFLQGPTLLQLLKTRPQHRMPVNDALRAAIHIGSALIHMHHCGYLHLDVKPANIIIMNGRPVLFDVGTAHRGARCKLAEVIGSDDYMSPEQYRRGTVSAATDVYGLGVTLYEMLAGRKPFPSASRRLPAPPLKHPACALAGLRKGLPRGLADLVMSCLHLDPARRPTLQTLLVALNSFIRRGPAMLPVAITGQPESCNSR
jgi:eukaryotic-like serine/threonine-protein kinase